MTGLVTIDRAPHPAPNWTTAAGALEGVLEWLGAPLSARHAIMGLTGHAWHASLAARDGVVALPAGPVDLDWAAMVHRYARTGIRWERHGARLAPGDDRVAAREAAMAWMRRRLADGLPVVGFDFHVQEFAVVYGIDEDGGAFLVNSIMSQDLGPRVPFEDWPTTTGMVELFAPAGTAEMDALAVIVGSLETALEAFAGRDGPPNGQPRGTAALDAWADAFEGDAVVDRAGNAYLLAVVQAARLDGAAYLHDLAAALPAASRALSAAERALRDEARALSPLLTLFPFPAGGHGNVANPDLRQTAAAALRRAADHERHAAQAIVAALPTIERDSV